jgi:hypothetical protein
VFARRPASVSAAEVVPTVVARALHTNPPSRQVLAAL